MSIHILRVHPHLFTNIIIRQNVWLRLRAYVTQNRIHIKKVNRYLLKERIPIFHNLFKHGLNSTILFHILTICLVCYVFCFLFFACNFYTCRMLSIPYNIMDNRILVLFHVLFPYFYLLYSSIVWFFQFIVLLTRPLVGVLVDHW